eukprot:Skav236809  [mRNA]  locus=scaffold80:69043:72528:+ [translate_table: standard]
MGIPVAVQNLVKDAEVFKDPSLRLVRATTAGDLRQVRELMKEGAPVSTELTADTSGVAGTVWGRVVFPAATFVLENGESGPLGRSRCAGAALASTVGRLGQLGDTAVPRSPKEPQKAEEPKAAKADSEASSEEMKDAMSEGAAPKTSFP